MNLKFHKQEWHQKRQIATPVENKAYDGMTAEYGYEQAIFDLLKTPVSLGMRGAHSNRGHQR